MITGTVVLAGLAVALAILLILSSHYLPPAADPSADRLEELLPRIQWSNGETLRKASSVNCTAAPMTRINEIKRRYPTPKGRST